MILPNPLCNKCNGTFAYLGSITHQRRRLAYKDQVFMDENIPSIDFLFACRYCDNNNLVMEWSDNYIRYAQNWGIEAGHLKWKKITLHDIIKE